MALVKLSEFSRLCGVSKPAVSNWKREKKLVMVGDLVDVDASLARLGRVRRGGSPVHSDPAAPRVVAIELEPGESLDDAAARLAGEIDVDATSYDEARRLKEVYLALLHRQQYEQKSGSLVDLDLASSILFESARAARDAWLNWPSKIGALVAADLGIAAADTVTAVLAQYVHEQLAQIGEPEANFSER